MVLKVEGRSREFGGPSSGNWLSLSAFVIAAPCDRVGVAPDPTNPVPVPNLGAKFGQNKLKARHSLPPKATINDWFELFYILSNDQKTRCVSCECPNVGKA
jgi:hypothetical protein